MSAGSNRLTVLAADVQAAHLDIQASAEAMAERALVAGNALIEAKGLLQHGEWGRWLQDHCAMSERSAQRYMQMARAGLKSATVADLGIRGAAASIARRATASRDPSSVARADEFALMLLAMLADYASQPTPQRRRATRLAVLDTMVVGVGPAPLVQFFLRVTQEIENHLTKRGLAFVHENLLGWINKALLPSGTQYESVEDVVAASRAIYDRDQAGAST